MGAEKMKELSYQAAKRLPLDDPIYRPRIIAERTGKAYDTITAAIRAGQMKRVKLGKRSIGVRASEVQRWLDSMQAEGRA
jgi:predicted DNA-binding transcriptional regulator AlpA